MEIQIDVPDNTSGAWAVETFEITESAATFENFKHACKPGQSSRWVKPGTFKRLMKNGNVIMSNTRAEIQDHTTFIIMAKKKEGMY